MVNVYLNRTHQDKKHLIPKHILRNFLKHKKMLSKGDSHRKGQKKYKKAKLENYKKCQELNF